VTVELLLRLERCSALPADVSSAWGLLLPFH
jgi:hypothetical protein